jgi:hypothetical protein
MTLFGHGKVDKDVEIDLAFGPSAFKREQLLMEAYGNLEELSIISNFHVSQLGITEGLSSMCTIAMSPRKKRVHHKRGASICTLSHRYHRHPTFCSNPSWTMASLTHYLSAVLTRSSCACRTEGVDLPSWSLCCPTMFKPARYGAWPANHDEPKDRTSDTGTDLSACSWALPLPCKPHAARRSTDRSKLSCRHRPSGKCNGLRHCLCHP